MNKIWKIYKYTNTINQKIYIGQTCASLAQRAGKDGKNYGRCPYFYNAIQKYGWECFSVTILEDNIITQEEANRKEIYYIQLFDATNPDVGYNISIGGFQFSQNVSSGKKISTKIKKQWEKGGKLDKILREDIYCVELDKVFHGSEEAARFVGRSKNSICRACSGVTSYCGIINGQPLHWIYLKDKTPELIIALRNKKENLNNIKNKIYCIELNQYFDSANEAEQIIGISAHSIMKTILGKSAYAGFYYGTYLHWLYADEVNEENIIALKNRQEIFNSKIAAPIMREDTKKIYDNAKIAAEETGIKYNTLRRGGLIYTPDYDKKVNWIFRRDLVNNTKIK